jgi:hypothetical protein
VSSLITDIGNSMITAITGTDPATLQAQATAAEANLEIAISAMIGLQAIVALELFIIMVTLWKERRG